MVEQRWIDAGVSDEEGRVGRPIPSGYLLVPGKIDLDEQRDVLTWELQPSIAEKCTVALPRENMLDRFISLWRRPARSTLLFARSYGVLAMDANGKFAKDLVEGSEPLYRWRQLSRRAYAVLGVACALRDHKSTTLGDPSDWRVIDGSLDPAFPRSATAQALSSVQRKAGLLVKDLVPHGRAAARGALKREINGWLEDGGVTLRLTEGTRDWETELYYRSGLGLYGAIAIQLLSATAGTNSFYLCSECGYLYPRPASKRRPKPGEMNFCDNCASGTTKAKRSLMEAEKRRQTKVAEAKRLYAAGVSEKEIERTLMLKPGGATRLLAR